MGGFTAEPHVADAAEFSQHGFVDARGVLIGRACALTTNSASAPVKIEHAHTLAGALDEKLRHIAQRAAEELLRAGYFGPFGFDALVVESTSYLIDLNPRFTLGWSIGMESDRTEAIERALGPVAPRMTPP
jgi:hypothetical protein